MAYKLGTSPIVAIPLILALFRLKFRSGQVSPVVSLNHLQEAANP